MQTDSVGEGTLQQNPPVHVYFFCYQPLYLITVLTCTLSTTLKLGKAHTQVFATDASHFLAENLVMKLSN